MSTLEPSKIRNVAVTGHRGTGKTSLVEAMLFQSGAINRLGSVEQGSTVSDWDEDEQQRSMSIQASPCHVDWQGHKVNLIDTPGEASFQGDVIAALRVVEGTLIGVSGVMGIEVQTGRIWERAEQLNLARMFFVNMLDRERADFMRTLEQLREQFSSRCVAVHLPIGHEHELSGIVDVLHMRAYMSPEGERESGHTAIPDEMSEVCSKERERLLDAVVETDEALMERYLDGQELSPDEVAHALHDAVERGEIFPVACGVATKNLGTTALLDLIVEGVPSPDEHAGGIAVNGDGSSMFVFKTLADPFAGRINVFRVLNGSIKSDSTVVNARAHAKERIGHLLALQGKEHTQVDELVAGDIGAIAKLKETVTGDLLVDSERELDPPKLDFPEPVMSFAVSPKAKGDEEKVVTALRRLQEEDPTLNVRRDQQTGEQLLSGLSQMHVEVAVDRVKRRFGVDVELRQPRVPYVETIRKAARAQGRHKKQTGGRGQFGDKIVGGVIPQGFRPAVDKGIQEAMLHGGLAGAPIQGVRVQLVDGSYHTVDSSEMAFKIAGSLAFKSAYEQADPVLLEPIMELQVITPDDAVGAVNGDLNSRRSRLHGMEHRGGMTAIKDHIPLAEILTYGPALTSLTGGRGDYHMHFLRYDEVPTHVAQKVIEATKKEQEEEKAHH